MRVACLRECAAAEAGEAGEAAAAATEGEAKAAAGIERDEGTRQAA